MAQTTTAAAARFKVFFCAGAWRVLDLCTGRWQGRGVYASQAAAQRYAHRRNGTTPAPRRYRFCSCCNSAPCAVARSFHNRHED
jgi:hypothetical protein